MPDYTKLNSTIEALEKEADNLKSINSIIFNLEQSKSTLTEYRITIDQMVSGVQETTAGLKNEIDKLALFTSRVELQLKEHQSQLNIWIENLTKQNHQFIREFEDGLNSRLEKHKSDIQVDLRNESVQIQRGVENKINEKMLDMVERVNTRFDKFQTNMNTLKRLAWVSIVLMVLASAAFAFSIISR